MATTIPKAGETDPDYAAARRAPIVRNCGLFGPHAAPRARLYSAHHEPLPFRAPVDHPAALAGGDLPFGLQSVCRTLADANATLERFAWLGDHLAIAEWTRITDESETVYEQPGHHTLSCYLDGGYRTERQRVPRYGAPSLLCALPGDHESRWWVRGEMHFIHLYFLPEHFTQRAIRELDREPRELKLADRTYFEDARVAAAALARAGRLGRCRRTAARERDRARGAEPAAARTEHDPHRHVVPRRPHRPCAAACATTSTRT